MITNKGFLEQHETSLPEVILSDLNMPGKNGYDILEGIKADPAYRHVPVIITSTAKVMIDRCLNLGAAGYLVKPDTFIAYAPFASDLYKLLQEQQLLK